MTRFLHTRFPGKPNPLSPPTLLLRKLARVAKSTTIHPTTPADPSTAPFTVQPASCTASRPKSVCCASYKSLSLAHSYHHQPSLSPRLPRACTPTRASSLGSPHPLLSLWSVLCPVESDRLLVTFQALMMKTEVPGKA